MKWNCLIAGLLVALAGPVQAHVGDRLYMVFELTDDDLRHINLYDGSADDWRRVVGEPSLTTLDFSISPIIGDVPSYDPEDLDFKIWLGWHQATGRIYVAMESVDDVYYNEYVENVGSSPFITNFGINENDSISFMIDGDHSGGDYSGGDYELDLGNSASVEEWKQATYSHAQAYGAIAFAQGSPYVTLLRWPQEWFSLLPYVDGGGGLFGVSPTTSVIEFYVTAFDNLIKEPKGAAVVSSLSPGKVIGFSLVVPDYDSRTIHASYLLPPDGSSILTADVFADGLLVGKNPIVSAVGSDSWGRIKASFENQTLQPHVISGGHP